MRKASLVLALLLPVAGARANGRFPQAMSVVFKPGDPQKIWVGTTFGLLYSPDDGDTWLWMCEQSLGYQGIHDPVYAVTSTGTLFATIYDGLRVSRDGGCSWNQAGNGLDGMWMSDVERASNDDVWTATQSTAMPNDVYVSHDDGVTFTPTGLTRPRSYWKSLRVAPSAPNRVYVTGYQMPEPVDAPGSPTPLFFRTDDAAGPEGWLQIPFSQAGAESQLKLLGVSRANPDVVFVRIDDKPNDTVFRSDDAGVGWEQVLVFENDDANAFLSSEDGMTIVIGSAYSGAQISRNGGMSFEPLAGAPHMFCGGVRDSDEDAFVCSSNWDPDYMAFGRSSDLSAFTKVVRFVELDGALDCPAGTPQATECAPMWCNICDMFACEDAACGHVNLPDGAGRDGSVLNGGDGGSGPFGCCRVAGGRTAGLTPAGILLAVVGLLVVRGARRRRRRRPR